MTQDKIAIYTQPEDQQEQTIEVTESVKEKLENLIEQLPSSSSELPLYEDLKKRSVDFEGIEIPEGKIPLDGQFSTKEVQKIVEIAQEHGILNDDITVQLVDKKPVGDTVVIADPKEKEEKEEEEEAKATNEAK
ncbi:hypothetical protein Cantr_08281 [Candida viswanathii]|uniref:Uncharacterized protein n=1 Tax=Candida viswanathii TaxID=5486 RepID=A0A367Y3D9_9ASCO|nr:hypothetical protein Cantr_08281 [Candida viswanathii]